MKDRDLRKTAKHNFYS